MRPTVRTRDPLLRAAGVFELVVAAGVAGFWLLFFAGGQGDLPDPLREQAYHAFESAFPAADAALVLALLGGGLGLLRGGRQGPPLSLAAGGALAFLGLVDAAFNARHGVYAVMPLQAAVNAVCAVGGAWLAVVVWRHRGSWPRPRGAGP